MFACRLCSNLGSKIVQTTKSLASMLKNIVSYPPLTHAFLKWPFLTDFKKYTHTPPYGMKFWCSGRKMVKTLKIHEFAPRWHIMNVPERYVETHRNPLSPSFVTKKFVLLFVCNEKCITQNENLCIHTACGMHTQKHNTRRCLRTFSN